MFLSQQSSREGRAGGIIILPSLHFRRWDRKRKWLAEDCMMAELGSSGFLNLKSQVWATACWWPVPVPWRLMPKGAHFPSAGLSC